jgi:nucleosome binding factor SPN SPT16 subunit
MGTLVRGEFSGSFIPSWKKAAENAQVESIDCSLPLGKILCVKDDIELELCKRAAVLSNKVLKHGNPNVNPKLSQFN